MVENTESFTIISKKYDRHNLAKLKIFHAIDSLQKNNLVANSVRIADLTNKTVHQTTNLLRNLSINYPYLASEIDRKRHDGCTLKYSFKKEGLSVYKKLMDRYRRSLDLNLKKDRPEKVEYKK